MAITLQKLVEVFNLSPDPNGSIRAKTPKFRSSYANVFEPKETPSGEMKYGISMIFLKDERSALKELCQSMVNASAKKFGANAAKWPKNMRCPLRDGDEEREGKEYENSFFINAGSKNAPGIIDIYGNHITQSDGFYSGCYARATVAFYPFDVSGNKGVGTGLNNLLFVEHGERLDGASKAEDDFSSEIKEPSMSDQDSALDAAGSNSDSSPSSSIPSDDAF